MAMSRPANRVSTKNSEGRYLHARHCRPRGRAQTVTPSSSPPPERTHRPGRSSPDRSTPSRNSTNSSAGQ
ncbi:hypothetical protein B2J88_51730, partial [Rhodococcus sp. SRB_17]|nr:hypothetical protein [Rhodococcus sp. SRB_17]